LILTLTDKTVFPNYGFHNYCNRASHMIYDIKLYPQTWQLVWNQLQKQCLQPFNVLQVNLYPNLQSFISPHSDKPCIEPGSVVYCWVINGTRLFKIQNKDIGASIDFPTHGRLVYTLDYDAQLYGWKHSNYHLSKIKHKKSLQRITKTFMVNMSEEWQASIVVRQSLTENSTYHRCRFLSYTGVEYDVVQFKKFFDLISDKNIFPTFTPNQEMLFQYPPCSLLESKVVLRGKGLHWGNTGICYPKDFGLISIVVACGSFDCRGFLYKGEGRVPHKLTKGNLALANSCFNEKPFRVFVNLQKAKHNIDLLKCKSLTPLFSKNLPFVDESRITGDYVQDNILYKYFDVGLYFCRSYFRAEDGTIWFHINVGKIMYKINHHLLEPSKWILNNK